MTDIGEYFDKLMQEQLKLFSTDELEKIFLKAITDSEKIKNSSIKKDFNCHINEITFEGNKTTIILKFTEKLNPDKIKP